MLYVERYLLYVDFDCGRFSELGELGGCLARVEDLVERARGLQEVVRLGLLQVDQSAARKVLVTSFRQQQQRMHQDVSQ